MEKELAKVNPAELAAAGTPMGFEDEEAGDVIIPRVKVIQTLSPERKEKQADEGDIINSLTKEKLNGKVFIPAFKFNNNRMYCSELVYLIYPWHQTLNIHMAIR